MASLISGLKEAVSLPTPLPPDVKKKIERGRDRLRRIAPKNFESWRFYRGDHYVYVDTKGLLQQTPTSTNPVDRTGKAPHKVRTRGNLIMDFVDREVSSAVQRVPSYDVLPTSLDPKRIDAAQLAEKVALYLHYDCNVSQVVEKVAKSAVVTGEGFAWPYYDANSGDICVRVYGANEVFWEPGTRFEETPWLCIEHARSIDDVKNMEGFDGKPLKPDANTSDIWTQRQQQPAPINLVIVTEYLERPTKTTPNGRWIVVANGRQIVPERPYPCADKDGKVCDEPCLIKLHSSMDADSDRDQGLVDHLKDPMRVSNDCRNKALEAKNLGLVPQIITQRGNWAPNQPRTDEPGAVYEVNDASPNAVRWIDPPPPELFVQLQALASQAEDMMRTIAAQADVSPQQSGDAIQAQQAANAPRRELFLSNVARFYSELMHRMLWLVQMYWTDAQTLRIEGAFGFAAIENFKGSDLSDELDVRVAPESISPLTREALEQKLTFYAQMGWVDPQKAIAAIQAGTAEGIVQSYELQIRSEQRNIQRAVALAGTLTPFATASDFAKAAIPEAKPYENQKIRMQVLTDFFSSSEWDYLPPEVQHVLELLYQQRKMLQQQEVMQQMQETAALSQQLGSANAARPTQPGGGTNMPSPPQQPQASPPSGNS